MVRALNIFAICLALTSHLAAARNHGDDDGNTITIEYNPSDNNQRPEADQFSGPMPQLIQKQSPTPPMNVAPAPAILPMATKEDVKGHAEHAKEAAVVAKQAAKVANQVAKHSVKVTGHAKKALSHALGALHDARVESAGLDKRQKATLKKAEAHLREATKTADHGELKKIEDRDLQKEKMETELKGKAAMSEKEHMRTEIDKLRKKLKEKKVDDKDISKALDELEAAIEKQDGPINDESKAELERLRHLVDSLEAPPAKEQHQEPVIEERGEDEKVTPVIEKGLDIDTQMPYGDLEPFGREDTAQELTESSIKESDAMVDQLERAEVAEEKRAVFRALTRLRGAAITSYDGVARSQTGNIDEYNKVHKWRGAHPLHHLADEESDVSKWAFPDNADF